MGSRQPPVRNPLNQLAIDLPAAIEGLRSHWHWRHGRGDNLGSARGRPLFGTSRRRPVHYRLEKRDDPRSGRWTGRRDHCSLCRRYPVAGRTTRAVQTIVEHAVQGKAIQPQVLVNVAHPLTPPPQPRRRSPDRN
jgi:hypothetical protein